MAKLAIIIPKDWIISEKSLAIEGFILKNKVMIGKATAPPPSEVAPAMKEAKIIVTLINQFFSNK